MPGNKGLEVIEVIQDSELPDRLLKVILNITRQKYTDVRIVPGIVAAEGTDFKFDRPVHVVYGILPKSKKHSKTSARLIGGEGLIFRADGSPYVGPYNHIL